MYPSSVCSPKFHLWNKHFWVLVYRISVLSIPSRLLHFIYLLILPWLACFALPALPCLLFRDDERGKSLVSRCVCDNNNNNNQYIHKVHLHVSRPQRDSRQDSHPRTVTIPTDPVSTILQLGFTSLSSLHHSHTTLPYHRTNRKFNLRYECHLLPVF